MTDVLAGGRRATPQEAPLQIPCFNEEGALNIALEALPREVLGFDVVEWLVIDDGSMDRTVEVALENGVDHIVSMRHNQGLAKGFMAGLEACLRLGADTIVNTDVDNQYDASCIPGLVAPIVKGEADYVIGASDCEPPAFLPDQEDAAAPWKLVCAHG